MDYIYAILTIAWFALAFTIKGESVSNYAPAYGRWRDALRDADWWYDRMLDGKVLSTLMAFSYGLIAYANYQGLNDQSIPVYDLKILPALAFAAGWLVAVAPSMGEEYGAMIGKGEYIEHKDDFGFEYAFKKGIQRGVFMGASMAAVTGETAFIWASLAYMPIAWAALNAGEKYGFKGWAAAEVMTGAVCFGAPCVWVFVA